MNNTLIGPRDHQEAPWGVDTIKAIAFELIPTFRAYPFSWSNHSDTHHFNPAFRCVEDFRYNASPCQGLM